MRLRLAFSTLISILVMTVLMGSEASARKGDGEISLLVLRVSSNRLGANDLAKLTRVVLLKLKKYPAYAVRDVPAADPMDMMVDAGCIDFDAECLATIGSDAGVDKVLYTEVSDKEGRFLVQISMVDVKTRESMTPEGGVEAGDDLDRFVAGALEKVLGPEPIPETVLARVDIATEPPGAEVYLDKDFIGVSPVTLRLKEGDYTVRMTRVGYNEVIQPLTVVAGKQVTKNVSMTRVEVAVPVEPVPVKERTVEKKPYWKTWWFWTTISAVVVAGTVTGAVLGTRGGGGSEGSARFTLDPSYAPMDVTLYPRK